MFGAKLRALRESLGLSRSEAATLVAKTERAWQSWELEQGEFRRRPDATVVRLLHLIERRPDVIDDLKAIARKEAHEDA